MVAAAPAGEQQPLNLKREWVALKTLVQDKALPVTLVRLVPPTREVLVDVLDRSASSGVSPHVLHFAGHGEPGHLLFEDSQGGPVRYRREELVEDLRGRGIQLIFMNACHSATRETLSLARYLTEAKAAEAAIGHEFPVSDNAAISFATYLYQELCQGHRLVSAFGTAKAKLSQSAPGESGVAKCVGNDGLRFFGLESKQPEGPFVHEDTAGHVRLPEIDYFFGRTQELLEMGSFLERENSRVMALMGMGGIGKTAIALECAHRHTWRFHGGVAFASASHSAEHELSAEALLRSVMKSLLLPAGPWKLMTHELHEHLRRQPGLLVLDGLERLPDAEFEHLLSVLESLPPNGSKAVLTLRSAPGWLFKRDWIQICVLTQGLPPQLGAAYVVRMAHGRGLELTQAGSLEDRISQGFPFGLATALAGHPKMLEVAVQLAAEERTHTFLDSGLSPVPPAQLQARAEALAVRVLETCMGELLAPSLERLDVDGQRLLPLLMLFPVCSFTQRELVAVLAAMEDAIGEEVRLEERIRTGITSCIAAGLLRRDVGSLYWIHPTVQDYMRQTASVEQDALSRVFGSLLRCALLYVAEHVNSQGGYDLLEARLELLMSLFEQVYQMEEIPDEVREAVLKTVDAMGSFFLRRGHWSLMADWRARVAQRKMQTPDERSRSMCLDATLLVNLGKYEEARSRVDEVLQLNEMLQDGADRGPALYELAQLELQLGQYEKAEVLLAKALQIQGRPEVAGVRAASLHGLARIRTQQGRYSEARTLLQDAFQENRENDQNKAALLHQLALIDVRQELYDPARERLGSALELWKSLKDRRGQAAAMQLIAEIAIRQGRYVEARGGQREVIQLDKDLGNLQGQASSLHQLILMEVAQGQFNEARRLLAETLPLFEELRDFRGRVMLQHQKAIVDWRQGRHAEARAELLDELRVWTDLDEPDRQLAALNLLISVEMEQEHWEDARLRLDEMLLLVEKLKNQGWQAAFLYQKARLVSRQTSTLPAQEVLLEARSLLEQSLQLALNIKDRQSAASTLHELGLVAQQMSDIKGAKEFLMKSLRLREEIGDWQGHSASLNLLVQVFAQQGQAREAMMLIKQSHAIAKEINDRQGIATCLVLLGRLEVEQGHFKDGIRDIRAGLSILKELGDPQYFVAFELLQTLEKSGASPTD
jgi:tetratricopeptide (TPR) repeat protein